MLDPSVGDGIDLHWFTKLTWRKLIPFDELLHVWLNMGFSVARLQQEQILKHLGIECPDFPELNRAAQGINRWGLALLWWKRESDACSSPHRRCKGSPLVPSEEDEEESDQREDGAEEEQKGEDL